MSGMAPAIVFNTNNQIQKRRLAPSRSETGKIAFDFSEKLLPSTRVISYKEEVLDH
tara:strand:+ start:39697 stop:39864 length:168 start_codon:yes stop_codon:yes gene_type:complete